MKPLDTSVGKIVRKLHLEMWGTKYVLARSQNRLLTLPPTIKSVCDGCLRESNNIEEIVIPQNVECIGEYAFASQTLKKVEFLNAETPAPTSISSAAYNKRKWLWLKPHAFDETPLLTELELPNVPIHLGAHSFGPNLRKIRFYCKTLPEIEPDAFASAKGLKTIIVDRSCIEDYSKVLSTLCPGAVVEPYLTPEEVKALKKQQKEVRIRLERELKEAQKVDATIRIFLPADQSCEIRWTDRSPSPTPSIVSQSHPVAIFEMEYDGQGADAKAYYMEITRLKDWNKLCKQIWDNKMDGVKGGYADWKMYPKAPKVAHTILQNLLEGYGDEASSAIDLMMYEREKSNSHSYNVVAIEDLDGQGLLLEYRIKLDPDGFDLNKLTFFSFKGKTINDEDELLGNLSRQGKVRVRNQEVFDDYNEQREDLQRRRDEARQRRQSGMGFITRMIDDWINSDGEQGIKDDTELGYIEYSNSDDNIIWYDFINYDNQLGVLMNVYRVDFDDTKILLNPKVKG